MIENECMELYSPRHVHEDRLLTAGFQMVADLVIEYGVEVFIYSSTLQPSANPDKTPNYSRISKKAIEDHCRGMGSKGLNWM